MVEDSLEDMLSELGRQFAELESELSAKGWVYREIVLEGAEDIDRLLAILGEGNSKLLSTVVGNKGIRVQMMVSPKGVANLNEFRKELGGKWTRLKWMDNGVQTFIDNAAATGQRLSKAKARRLLEAAEPLFEMVVRDQLAKFAGEFVESDRVEKVVEDYITKKGALAP